MVYQTILTTTVDFGGETPVNTIPHTFPTQHQKPKPNNQMYRKKTPPLKCEPPSPTTTVTTLNIQRPTNLPPSNNVIIDAPELLATAPLPQDHHITHPITTPHRRRHHYSPNDDHRSPKNHKSKRRNILPPPYPNPPKTHAIKQFP
ncbi:hypothetical protein RND81_12G049200 [Saponaria officinalis]|uniref:Uncharacterized protein n=1 Tax=Saponaria officinalis TaxID=3572 RepID=A0AAW1H3A9_SAPOF